MAKLCFRVEAWSQLPVWTLSQLPQGLRNETPFLCIPQTPATLTCDICSNFGIKCEPLHLLLFIAFLALMSGNDTNTASSPGVAKPSECMDSQLEVLWTAGQDVPSLFPCVDCGFMTGNFCDGGISVEYDRCFATDRVPKDFTVDKFAGLRTPLCPYCETRFEFCRFCRGIQSCTPPKRSKHWSDVPLAESRHFSEARAQIARDLEFARRANDASAVPKATSSTSSPSSSKPH